MRSPLPLLVLLATACQPNDDTPQPTHKPTADKPLGRLSLETQVAAAGQTFPEAAPFVIEFSVPEPLVGGGLPNSLTDGTDVDRSLLQLEIPQTAFKSDEIEDQYIGSWSEALLCRIDRACPEASSDGHWFAMWFRGEELLGELQLARVTLNTFLDEPDTENPTPMHTGVWLPVGDVLERGDRVQLTYVGTIPKRATDWTSHPLHLHFRYRSNPDCPAEDDDCWTVLEDSQVDPLTIEARPPAFVHAIAPMDAVAGEPFELQLVVTDKYGNPSPVAATIALGGDVDSSVTLDDEWRATPEFTYANAGDYRIVPTIPGVRGVHNWTAVTDGPPIRQRLVGDVHFHTGDGGAQRKFLRSFSVGDHAGLYTRSDDALRYLDEVVGFDFGAPSEHAIRDDEYTLPPGVASDPAFQEGGECEGAGTSLEGIGNWWPLSQQISRDYRGDLITFPAFEWHSRHGEDDASKLHRVVLFKDHHPDGAHPMIPGDVPELPPQCIVRFAMSAGLTPDDVLILPHMMVDHELNIDWDLSYRDTFLGSLATLQDMEAYQTVGEIFSSRNLTQAATLGVPTLLLFEGDPVDPTPFSFRYAWRDVGVHIGVVAGSDNHSQMPGVNDETAADGSEYHFHEPGGQMVVLADSRDRNGIYGALQSRRTYGTSGPRVWLDFSVDGADMGSEISRSASELTATLKLMAGMSIYRVELFAAPVGDPTTSYEAIRVATPLSEVWTGELGIDNPVAVGDPDEEWIYYTRALMLPLNGVGGRSEAAWSSPVWVTWSGG